MIAVVDYRAGNAPSVLYALEHLGLPARLVDSAADVTTAERIILPGVGAARATIDSLVEQDLVGDRLPALNAKHVELAQLAMIKWIAMRTARAGQRRCLRAVA